METLLTLLIFGVVAVISAWLKRKQADEFDTSDDDQRPAPRSAPPPRSINWEEEMRRLLHGEEATPPPRTVVPPPVRPPAPAFAPPTPPPLPPAPARPVASTPTRAAETDLLLQHLARLEQRPGPTTPQAATPPLVVRKLQAPPARDPYLAHALALVRQPAAARVAIIAATILGSPKGLEA